MQTNQLMTRDGIKKVQRTKDDFFNATAILKEWNKKNPDKQKIMAEYNKLKSTIEFVRYLKENESIDNPLQSSTKGTWMYYKVFIDFAMWVSLEFKSLALGCVFDGLIKSRNEAGDYHKEMCATIMETHIDIYGTKPPAMLFINESRMIKQIANLDIERNEMTEKDLSRLTMLQKVNSTLIKKNVGRESRKKHLSIVNESMV
jgi:hypothetical protein